MRTVYLHGKLGKRFGKKWRLDVSSAQEAVSAIDANQEGFIDYILTHSLRGDDYYFLKKSPDKIKSKEDLKENVLTTDFHNVQLKQSEIHLVPKTYGGFVSTVMIGIFGKGLVASIATSMVWGAVTQVAMNALFKPPKSPTPSAPVSTKSFLLQGATNRTAQGIPVPVGYGRVKIGSTNVSATKRSMPLYSSPKKVTRKGVSSTALESYTEITYVDLLSEGPIEGFVGKYGGPISGGDMREGIFLNDVQIKNTSIDGNGTFNYILSEKEDELPPDIKLGGQMDSKILSNSISSIIDYDQMLYGASPYNKTRYTSLGDVENSGGRAISHVVLNENVSKVTFSFKAELSKTVIVGGKKDREAIRIENSVYFGIYIYRDNSFVNILASRSGCSSTFRQASGVVKKGAGSGFSLTGIATSPYQFDIDVNFNRLNTTSEKVGGIIFKIVKLSAEYDPSVKDDDVGGLENVRNLQLAHVEEIVESKMLYPHTAATRITFDSKNFSNVPSRSYHLKLKKVLVPSNYDPLSRKYVGPWNGLFRGQESSDQSIHTISDQHKYWTDNPAWIFFDLLNNFRYGLGKYGLEEENIDKWQLYKVAKYCDELVQTDYPFDTENSIPKPFETFNKLSNQGSSGAFEITVDSGFFKVLESGEYAFTNHIDAGISNKSSSDIFKSEFGDGGSYKGKKIAFFMYQHSFNNERLNNGQIDIIKNRSAKRQKEYVVEERTVLSANPLTKKILVRGPVLDETGVSFIGEDSGARMIVGACAVQVNHPVLETRFSTNIYLTDRSKALDMINSMTAIFRGMATYSGGKIFTTQDAYKKTIMMFNNSNVSKTGFAYSGMNKNKRITASMVRFNNKYKNFKPDLVYEEDPEGMRKLGYIENETLGFGITSESQARRLAKWVLFTSQLETETIKFTAGQEASYLIPGSVFEVSDEYRAGKDKSGRVLGVYEGRNYNINGQMIQSASPYVVIDKSIKDCPSVSNIEFSVSCGLSNESIKSMEGKSSITSNSYNVYNSEEDQDIEIESVNTPQILRFNGSISSIKTVSAQNIEQSKTIITNINYKKDFTVDTNTNIIKCFNHGLDEAEEIAFISEGILPGGIEEGFIYKVTDLTKHTFKIYKFNSEDTVNIFDIGKDRFLNKGGDHYFMYKNNDKLQDALNQIHIGAPYSIKGLIGTRDSVDWTQEQFEIVGAQEQQNQEFLQSDFLGFVSADNEWIFSPTLEWVYIEQLRTKVSNLDQMWLFEKDIGWFWTNNIIKDSYWYVLSINRWIAVQYASSSKEVIESLFVYENPQEQQLLIGDMYQLGDSKLLPVVRINQYGYYLSLVDSIEVEDVITEDFNQEEVVDVEIDFNENPGYHASGIKEFHSVSSNDSIQGEDSVLIEFFDGHGLDIEGNNTLYIENVNSSNSSFDSSINSRWSVVYVNENAVELVNSSAQKTILDSIQYSDFQKIEGQESIGSVYYIIGPDSRIQRNLEGQLFRVLNVKEIAENQFEVTGLEYNSSKFDFIDKKGVSRKPRSPIPPQADMDAPESPEDLIITDLTL